MERQENELVTEIELENRKERMENKVDDKQEDAGSLLQETIRPTHFLYLISNFYL